MSNDEGRAIGEQVLSTIWGTMVRIGPAMIVALFYVAVVLHFPYTLGAKKSETIYYTPFKAGQ